MPREHVRLSELVISCTDRTPEEIGRRLGVPSDEPDSAWWVTRVCGDDASDIDSLTSGVLDRIGESWPRLEALVAEGGAQIVMRVVAYLSPVDRVGGGIYFDTSQLQRLVSVGAVLDFDLYSVE